MNSRSTRRFGDRAAAFTLIELLSVIAIIGLLATLLFPVFAKVRERARQTTCASNMRQIGQAFLLYAQDYDERLPDQGFDNLPNNLVAITLHTDWETYLRPYLRNTEVSKCPSDHFSEPVPIPGTGIVLLNSYATPFNVEGRPLAEMPAAALTVLQVENRQYGGLGDGNWLVSQLGKTSFTPEEGIVFEQPDFRHNETSNYLYLDMHVKSRRGPNPTFEGYRKNAAGVAVCGAQDPTPR